MSDDGGNEEEDADEGSRADPGGEPDGSDGNDDDGLPPLDFEGVFEDIPDTGFGEFGPGIVIDVEGIEHESQNDEGEIPGEGVSAGGEVAVRAHTAEECEPEGESDGEMELGHHEIGIAAPGVVMSEEVVDRGESSDEIDEVHSGDGVSSKLIEGEEAIWGSVLRHVGIRWLSVVVAIP